MTSSEAPPTTPTMGPGTLLVDTSALLCRYVDDRRRTLVDETIGQAEHRVVTALAVSELRLALHQVATTARANESLWQAARDDLDNYWKIPLDERCMASAGEVGARYGLGVVNAIHLAAFDRIPRPATLLTFDKGQVSAAATMGFEVYTSPSTAEGAHGLLA